jgi:hypothetical protein
MTPADLYTQLCAMGVTLTATPDGGVHVRAPVGVLTPVLKAAMQACKPALWLLAQPPQQGAYAPFPAFRVWVTGNVPPNGVAMTSVPLPTPVMHDTPSPARTGIGMPCSTKGCPPSAQYPSGRPASRRYQPTGLCVACLERLMKKRHGGYP